MRQKSKMAAKLPDVPITLLFFYRYTCARGTVVPKTIHKFMTMYEISKSPAIMVDAISYRKSKMAANQPEVVISRKLRNISKFQRLPPGPKKLEVALVTLFFPSHPRPPLYFRPLSPSPFAFSLPSPPSLLSLPLHLHRSGLLK